MRPVEAVNALTQRWSATAGDDSGVLSGFGVWPLLAYIADAADQPGRDELQAALGVSAADALVMANEVLASVASSPAVKVALGLWTGPGLPVKASWSDRLPLGAHEVLTGDPSKDQDRLDTWARDNTDGLIERFPAAVDAATRLLLASALLVKTTWVESFRDATWQVKNGPWASGGGSGGSGAGRAVAALTRTTRDLDKLRIVDTPGGPVSVLTVEGSGGIDVQLVLGEQHRAAADILSSGVAALTSPARRTGSGLAEGSPGPGVVVRREISRDRGDRLTVGTVRFHLTSQHDLLNHGEVFGLQAVTDGRRGRFPGISPEPLYVNLAKQNAMAEFTADGFRAAAVTAIGMMRSAAMASPSRHAIKVVEITFDRPFAFYAVHRETGLVLAAGWVAEPERVS